MASTDHPEQWFRYYSRVGDAPMRVVCFPHAGGSAPFFLPLATRLAPGIEVVSVQYPGRLDRYREPLIDDLGLLADILHESIGSIDERPTALFGHSMGALIAFEVARRMESDGTARPLALFASGRRAPTTVRPESLDLTDDQLKAQLSGLGGTSRALLDDEKAIRPILRVMRNDYRAVENYAYTPGPKLNCPIVALIGTEDSRVTVPEARLWESETNSEFLLKEFPGGHFYLTDACADVASAITEVLRNSEEISRI
ncbi:thioesterase II family protein [Streptomyces sp. NPDC002513]